jgi:hypothetical protein
MVIFPKKLLKLEKSLDLCHAQEVELLNKIQEQKKNIIIECKCGNNMKVGVTPLIQRNGSNYIQCNQCDNFNELVMASYFIEAFKKE